MELRRELRAWLRAHVTPEVVDAGLRPVADESLETLRAWNRQLAIAGGTSEINRNIVAEQGLGLPRG
jgi:hypothetical protein